MKRKKYYRERGRMDAKYIQRKSYPSPKKNPHVLPQGKLVFAGNQHPPRLSLLNQNQKGHVTSISLFSSHLSTPQNPSLPLSHSLSATIFNKPIPSKKKTIIPTIIVVVRNQWWYRKWSPRITTRNMFINTLYLFSMFVFNKAKQQKKVSRCFTYNLLGKGCWLSWYIQNVHVQ